MNNAIGRSVFILSAFLGIGLRSAGANPPTWHWSSTTSASVKRSRPAAKPKAIGIDLGGTNVRVAAIDRDGYILGHTKIPLATLERKSDLVIATLDRAIRDVFKEFRVNDLPVGIGIAGMIDATQGVVHNAPNLGWRDVPLRDRFAAKGHRNVTLYNDMPPLLRGVSAEQGYPKGEAKAAIVTFSTGIGAEVPGHPVELGHTVVDANCTDLCGCGNRGCVEAVAGGAKLAEKARSLYVKSHNIGGQCLRRDKHLVPSPGLLQLVASGEVKDFGELNAGHLAQLEHDPREKHVRQILAQARSGAALAIANLGTLFDIKKLYIVGPLAPIYLPQINEVVRARGQFIPSLKQMQIEHVDSTYAGMRGAGILAREAFRK